MEGVEILSTRVVYETAYHILPFIISAIIILGISITVWLLNYFHWLNDGYDSCMYSLVSFVIAILILIIPTVAISAYPTDNILYVEHKVICSDEVNLNEFYETYNIIEQDGKIYTVHERR